MRGDNTKVRRPEYSPKMPHSALPLLFKGDLWATVSENPLAQLLEYLIVL